MSTESPAADPVSESRSALSLDAAEMGADVTRYVIVEVNSSDYGFPTGATVELMSSSAVAVTRVPKSPGFVRGVINHRGSIIPVVNTRRLLGLPTIDSQADEIIGSIDECARERVAWFDALEAAIGSSDPFDMPNDPARCSFGRWHAEWMSDDAKLQFLSRFDQTLRTTLADMEAPHRRIHRAAEKALGLRSDGRAEDAIRLLEDERGTSLRELGNLLGKVRVAVERGVRTMLVITEFGERRAAFEVDAVHTVRDCADSDVECLPETATGSEFMRGLVHQDGGGYVLICDLEQMYRLACPK
ncbi:MAG: chemotaxis protein CheW [Planctomycetota bacterium]